VTDEDCDRDFFISYTQADRSWAEWIGWILEESGYRVLVQVWDFVPGTNFTQQMHDGTAHAARTIAVLSDDYLKSVYGKPEWLAAWQQDPDGAQRKLIPIRVANCDRPGLLAAVVGFDLFGHPEPQARARLLEGVASAATGRAKPTSKPGFPGARRAISAAVRFPGTLPSTWGRVPAHNPNFTGRDDELMAMKTSLNADTTVRVHSASGLGGVGKTQLAIEYAYRFASDYDVVWWIAAQTSATIPDHFAALATSLGLGPTDGPDELRVAVHDALRTAGGWLLIFDNADSVDDIGPWLPSGPVSAGAPGHVIVTTRRRGFRALGTVLDLDVIDMGAAVRLLLRSATQATAQAWAAAQPSRITIGYTTGLIVTPAVRELRREHPDADVQVLHVDWIQARDALLDHRVDAVVTRLPFPTDQLYVTILYDEPRVLVVPVDHRLAGRESVTLDDIADEPMPRLRHSDPAWSAFWRIDPRPDGRRAPDGPFIDALEDKFEVIAAGQAVAVTAGFHGNSLRPDITTVPLEGVEPSHVVLATRAGDRSRLVAAFRKLAEAHLTGPDRA
jgi:DNA-binding transcriptional LysR family regulator